MPHPDVTSCGPLNELWQAACALRDAIPQSERYAIDPDGSRLQAWMRFDAAITTMADAATENASRAYLAVFVPASDDLEVDEIPLTSEAESGTWISCWAWVDHPNHEKEPA